MNPLDPNGDVITYSGFFSGDFGDYLKAMAVDSEGVFYLAGYTDDFYFPVTPNAYFTANGGVRREFCLRHRHQAAREGRPDLLDLLRRNHHGYTHGNHRRRRQDLRHRVYDFRRLSGHRERLSEHAPGRKLRWIRGRDRPVAKWHREPGGEHLSGRQRPGRSAIDRRRCGRTGICGRLHALGRLPHHAQLFPPVLFRRGRCLPDQARSERQHRYVFDVPGRKRPGSGHQDPGGSSRPRGRHRIHFVRQFPGHSRRAAEHTRPETATCF